MSNEIQTIEQLSQLVGEIIFGTFFLLIGLISVTIAILRQGKGTKILIWLAVWSGMYGTRLLIISPAVSDLFPSFFKVYFTYIDITFSYLILVFALLTWLNLTRGKVHTYLKVMIYLSLANALAGISWYILSGNANTFMLPNNLIAASTLVVFVMVLSVRKLSIKFLVLPNYGVLAVGTYIFVSEALYSNLSGFFGYKTYSISGWIGFAVLLFSLAYVAAKMIFSDERRLITIENEMQTARQIQTSILPSKVPELKGVRVAASYYPMTAVAGDFYDFIEIDHNRAGFLIADVSGHGVPAALIASMLKVAVQSVVASAQDPGEVMRLLGNILGNQLEGQFVTAAYLYLDLEKKIARYSAAGHPPLLYWNSKTDQIQSIESNGLLLGVVKGTSYPTREFEFKNSDRFLLYTDGLLETENSAGEDFGTNRLSELIRLHKNNDTQMLNKILFSELKLWEDKKKLQQDDLTWIIVDII